MLELIKVQGESRVKNELVKRMIRKLHVEESAPSLGFSKGSRSKINRNVKSDFIDEEDDAASLAAMPASAVFRPPIQVDLSDVDEDDAKEDDDTSSLVMNRVYSSVRLPAINASR